MKQFLKNHKAKQPGLRDLTETLPGPSATTLTLKPRQPPPKRKKPGSVVGTETVTCKCGHQEVFELYLKDPYRNARREKSKNRNCKQCRDVITAENAAKQKINSQKGVRRAIKKNVKKPGNRYGKIWGRLPVGSNFNLTSELDANGNDLWKGKLTVPIHGIQEFTGWHPNLFGVCPKLDTYFRDWWMANHPEEAEADKARQMEFWQKKMEAQQAKIEEMEKENQAGIPLTKNTKTG